MAYTFSNAAGNQNTIPGPLKPLGYTQLTSIHTAAGLGTVPVGTKVAVMTAEAQAVRYRDDGTNPTASVGMPIAVGGTITYAGDMSAFKVIDQTSGGILNVSFYG